VARYRITHVHEGVDLSPRKDEVRNATFVLIAALRMKRRMRRLRGIDVKLEFTHSGCRLVGPDEEIRFDVIRRA